MNIFLKHAMSTPTDALNTVHLILPGATGHTPSTVLRGLQSTGHVIYLEGAYFETASEEAMLVEEISKQLSTLSEEARITEIHSYCAGIIPAIGLIHRLNSMRKLADFFKTHCYDPPFYPMPAATPSILCEKMMDGFKQGLKALLIENGFPCPDFTCLTTAGIESIEMLFCEVQTWIESVFSGNAHLISLGLDYCHNLLMQIRSSSIQEDLITLAADPSFKISCYFSDSMWDEDKMGILKTAAPSMHVQQCPTLTHGQMMGVTVLELGGPSDLTTAGVTKSAPSRVSSEFGVSMKSSGYTPLKPGFFKMILPIKFDTASLRSNTYPELPQ